MKKINFKKLIAVALSSVCVTCFAAGVGGCAVKSTDVTEPTNAVITKEQAPTDGSLPTAHTAAENFSYIAFVLDGQTQYNSYSFTVTSASIATQITRGYRDFKDGVLISSDITYSSMVKSGTQSCTVVNGETGEQEVYMRSSAAPTESTTAMNAEWDEGAPVRYDQSGYRRTYGLFQTELTNYIINEETIIESGEVKVNPDGTYTQSVTLDPAASCYYYQFGMKTRGGLGSYPEFSNVSVSVTFDEKWQVLSCTMHDVAKVNKGVTVTSTSDTTCTYHYGEEDFDDAHFAYYANYFEGYIGDASLEQGGVVDEKLVLDVTSVLSNGFAKVMDGGEQFELSVRLGKNVYVGYAFAYLDLADPLNTLFIKLSLGKDYSSQNFYLEYKDGEATAYYGEDFALGVNVAEVKLAAEQFSGFIDELRGVFSSLTADVVPDGDASESAESGGSDVLTDLMNCMTLETGAKETALLLSTDDLLGLGIGLDVRLSFGINDNKVVFRGGVVNNLSIGGEDVDLGVTILATTAPEISRDESEATANLGDYVADVYSLLSSDLIKVNVKLDGDGDLVNVSALKGLQTEVTAYADLDGLTVQASASVKYTYRGVPVSAAIDVWYGYDAGSDGYGKAVLVLKEFNGSALDVRLKCDVCDLADGIKRLLNDSGAQTGYSADSLVSLLNGALSADFSPLLTELYADGAHIKVGVSVDVILEMLGVDAGVKFGSCSLSYERGEGANGGVLSAQLPAIGFGMSVSGGDGEIEMPDDSDYLDLTYVLDDIENVIDSDTIAVGLNFDGSDLPEEFENAQVSKIMNYLRDLSLDATAYLDVKSGIAAKVDATVKYGNNAIGLTAWYEYSDGTYGKVVLQLNSVNLKDVGNVKIYCDISEAAKGIKTLLKYFDVSQANGQITGLDIDVATVLTNVLSADFDKLIPELSTSSNGLRLGVNVDEALNLLGVKELGFDIGTVTLAYDHGGENLLVATVPTFALTATANVGKEPVNFPSADDCLDLNAVIADVSGLLSAPAIEVGLKMDGTAVGVKGLKVNATAYVNIDDGEKFALSSLAAVVKLGVEYKYNDDYSLSAELTAKYVYAESGYGKVILSLDEFNGKSFAAKVSCSIGELADAVKALLNKAALEKTPFTSVESDASASEISKILANVIAADFNELLPDVSTADGVLSVAIDADEVLALFGVDLGVTVGKVALEYGGESDYLLSASVRGFGIDVTVAPSEKGVDEIDAPSADGALDLVSLINLVEKAWTEVDSIIYGNAIAFEITDSDTYLSIDGIKVSLGGKGEISWKNGEEYVALQLVLSIGENGKSSDATFNFIYDKDAVDKPVVRLAVNKVGINVYSGDIEKVSAGIKEIYKKITDVFGGSDGDGKESFSLDLSNASSNDELMAAIFDLLSNGNLLDMLNDFVLSADGQSLTLKYLENNSVSVSINNGIELCCKCGLNNFPLSFGGKIAVASVGAKSLADEISEALEDCTMVSSGEQNGFVRLAYDFLFDAFCGTSVEEILGSDTYNVRFKLNGNNCAISDLKDVSVNASLYVTGARDEKGKFAEADVTVDVKGVEVELNVITERVSSDDGNEQTHFYINLRKVLNFYLNLKVHATQDSLYETLEVLFKTVTKTDVLQFVKNMIPVDSTDDTDEEDDGEDDGENTVDESTIKQISKFLTNLFNFNYAEAITATESGGVKTAAVDLDAITEQFGLNTGASLGTVTAEIKTFNSGSHSIVAKCIASGYEEPWLFLSSSKTEDRSFTATSGEYISIEFLPTLLDDVVKTATGGDGNVYKQYTFTGSITVNILPNFINLQITISDIRLTLGFNESGQFYLSFMGKISGSTVDDHWIGMTYQDGYLTLARNMTSSPEYEVMTTAYFVDNIFNSDDSTVNWLLGSSMWGTVVSFLPSDIKSLDSGLYNTEDLWLYKPTEVKEEKEVSLYDYIDALAVVIGGKTVTEIQGTNTIDSLKTTLGVSDDYYGVDLNGAFITDGVLTELYLALTRDDTAGIDGVKAYGAISSYINFTADLSYAEGWTTEYTISSGDPESSAEVIAPSFYDKVKAAFITAKEGATYESEEGEYDEVFGCYVSSSGDVKKQKKLYSYTLTVHETDETVTEYKVRYGSTVYLYDNDYPVYDANGNRIVYADANGNLLGKSFTMETNTEVYAVSKNSVTVYLHSGSETYEVSSFEGDSVPVGISGKETIGAVYYDAVGTENRRKVEEGDTVGNVGELHVYGTFVETEVTVKYVKYTFDSDTLSYTATEKAAGFNDYYCTNKNTLVLENTIGGYPVTAIKKYAFANTEGKVITGVIVPANIVTVGENAFSDNYGMTLAVFLADTVTMCGTSDKDNNDAKDQPFYGCSTESGGTSTSLEIYYNTVIFGGKTDNTIWTKFRIAQGSGWESVMTYRYYIGGVPSAEYQQSSKDGGGKLYAKDNWNYYQYELVCGDGVGDDATKRVNKLLQNYDEGLTLNSYDPTDMQSLFTDELDKMTAERESCIGKYTVEVTSSKNAFGVTVIKVSVGAETPAYLVDLEDCAVATVEIEGNGVRVFDGKTYAKGTFKVTCEDISTGYKFVSATYGETTVKENPASFTALSAAAKLEVKFYATLVDVTIVSAIDFTYAGASYSKGTSTVSVATTEDGELQPVTPAAEGYVFLGWAVADDDGKLAFTTLSKATLTYYAIWGTSTKKTVTATVATSGSSLPTPKAKDGSSSKFEECWYTDVNFTAKAGTLTTACTVFYAREVYTVTLNISSTTAGDNSNFYCTGLDSQSDTKTASFTISVLESDSIAVTVSDDKHTVTIKVNDTTTYTITGYKRKFLGGDGDSRSFTLATEISDGMAINENTTIKLTY